MTELTNYVANSCGQLIRVKAHDADVYTKDQGHAVCLILIEMLTGLTI